MSCEGVSVIYGLLILKFVLWDEKQKGPLLYKTEWVFISRSEEQAVSKIPKHKETERQVWLYQLETDQEIPY